MEETGLDHSSSGIRTRLVEFLNGVPPFSYLGREDLFILAERVRIRFFGKGEIVYTEDGSHTGFLYVVERGLISIRMHDSGSEEVVDICDEGDVFGVDALLADRPYATSAVAVEDSMVLLVPWNDFRPILESSPKVSLFFAAGFASVGREKNRDHEAGLRLSEAGSDRMTALREEDALVLDLERPIIACTPGTTIREAARIMTAENVGSIIVRDDNERPLGILTDTDFRKRIVTGEVDIDSPVDDIMSSPVETVQRDLPVSSVIIRMMNRNIRHLCITEDGSIHSRVLGVVSEHDVLLLHGNNPAVLVKEIRQAKSGERLARIRKRADDLIFHYLDQGISVSFIAEINTEINDALIRRAIDLVLLERKAEGLEPPVPFCWLSLGSEGRKEQMLPTDQDNAILYDNPPDAKQEEAREFFLSLGKAVTENLATCGFTRCPSDMMASNPKWCLPLSQWEKTFHQWIAVPEPKALMHATIFFDFRPTYGEVSLAEKLTDSIYQMIQTEKLFLPYLAKNALLNPPPLSFFRGFILERGGEHKNQFDVKLRAMMPIADAARVLSLSFEIRDAYSTPERLRKIGQKDAGLATIATEASFAYEVMMRYRAKSGIEHGDSGRFLEPRKIGKIERQILRNSFQVINEFQTVLRMRFQLDYLG